MADDQSLPNRPAPQVSGPGIAAPPPSPSAPPASSKRKRLFGLFGACWW